MAGEIHMTLVGCIIYLLLACSVAQKQQRITTVRASITTSNAMPGDNVTITCEVTGLAKGEFLFLYKEVAGPAKPLVETVAINNNFQDPYSISRYSANFTVIEDTTVFKFFFTDAKKEDSGNYQCSSPDNEKTDMVTLTVFEPINELNFVNRTNSSDVIHFREGESREISCFSNGTTSIPHMSLFLGEHDISMDFVPRERLFLHCGEAQLSGKDCIIHSTFLSEKWAERLTPTYQHDGQILTCKGSFHQDGTTIDSKMASLKINVTYEPHIECQPEYELEIDSITEVVTCHIFANPSLNISTLNLSWMESSETVILLPNEKHGGVGMSLDVVSEKEHVVSLTFDKVDKRHFHKYQMNAENDLGDTEFSFNVKEKVKEPDTGGSTGDGHIAVLSSVLLLVMLLSVKLVH